MDPQPTDSADAKGHGDDGGPPDLDLSADAPAGAPTSPESDAPPDAVTPLEPPTFGRQMAQLVVIPAVITIACIAVALLFGVIAGRAESLDDLMATLGQSSGAGKMAGGINDPRYQQRCRAAVAIAQLVEAGKVDKDKYPALSRDLVTILQTGLSPDEPELTSAVLSIIGPLGQPEALDAVRKRFESAQPMVRLFAVRAMLSWPDRDVAAQSVPAMRSLLTDADPRVRAVAAAALGVLAKADDQATLDALHQAMTSTDLALRDSRWNAAVALARLGDEQGSRFVAAVLLDRKALADQPAFDEAPEGQQGSPANWQQQRMSLSQQERLILATLASASDMTHPDVWTKIEQMAETDPSLAVKKRAQQLLRDHQQGQPTD
jgi:HEAT repeat protein